MNVITLATKVTIARIILIVPTVIFYVLGMMLDQVAYLPLLIVACVLFTLLCSTDFIDGNIARHTNTVSDLGKFLDPLADKVVVVVMLFLILYFQDGLEIFAGNGVIIALLSGLIMSRELAIGVFRSIAAKKGIVLAADVFGKIKTVLLDVGVAFFILAGTNIVMSYIGTIVFYLGAVLAVFSGFNYLMKNKAVFSTKDVVIPETKEKE